MPTPTFSENGLQDSNAVDSVLLAFLRVIILNLSWVNFYSDLECVCNRILISRDVEIMHGPWFIF